MILETIENKIAAFLENQKVEKILMTVTGLVPALAFAYANVKFDPLLYSIISNSDERTPTNLVAVGAIGFSLLGFGVLAAYTLKRIHDIYYRHDLGSLPQNNISADN